MNKNLAFRTGNQREREREREKNDNFASYIEGKLKKKLNFFLQLVQYRHTLQCAQYFSLLL